LCLPNERFNFQMKCRSTYLLPWGMCLKICLKIHGWNVAKMRLPVSTV
jgi:hypothetical protein